MAEVDSFANEGLLKNSPDAKLTANLFLNTDSCTNEGIIKAVDCENDGVFINRRIIGAINFYNAITGVFQNDSGGAVSTVYFWNTGYFGNNSGSKINTAFDFYNGDSLPLSLSSVFYNDGFAGVGNDWYNTETINGFTGQFCVGDSTYNVGIMSGTFDFCDNTPPLVIPPSPVIDFYTDIGNIDTAITYCAYNCNMVVSF